MSVQRPAASCIDLPFAVPCPLEPSAQVALEDYARVLTGASAAEAISMAAGEVAGVHLCGLPSGASPSAQRDIVDFARDLAAASPGGGLGWS